MARLTELKPDDLDATNRKLAEKISATRGGTLQGPWAHMMRNPDLAALAANYSDYFRDGVSVPRKLALLGVIMVARHWNAGYVWNAQSPQAKAAGVSDEVIEAVRTKQAPSFSDPAEQAVYNLFSELYGKQSMSDATYATAEKFLGAKGMVEILNVAGFYSIIASIVVTTGIAPRPGQTNPFA
ncbi:MAG: carboxymuconolactone decarboxylase family protein [Burkholderiales bacterium]